MAGDVQATLTALLSMVEAKPGDTFLRKHVEKTAHFHKTLQHYVTKGPGIKPIRPEYLAATLSPGAAPLAVEDSKQFGQRAKLQVYGRAPTPVHGEGETEREVADQKVNGAAAGQTEPGSRTQPHAGRAPRHG